MNTGICCSNTVLNTTNDMSGIEQHPLSLSQGVAQGYHTTPLWGFKLRGTMPINESIVEEATLQWFEELGYAALYGPMLAPGEPAAERDSFGEVVLVGRLREAIRRLNLAIPEEARATHKESLSVQTPSKGA